MSLKRSGSRKHLPDNPFLNNGEVGLPHIVRQAWEWIFFIPPLPGVIKVFQCPQVAAWIQLKNIFHHYIRYKLPEIYIIMNSATFVSSLKQTALFLVF